MILTVIYIFTSCEKTQNVNTEIELELSADGPFFQGGNSFMVDLEPDFSKIFEEKTITSQDIKKINIKKAIVSFNAEDSVNFEGFTSASLQLVSDNIPMQSIAVLNPITSSSNTIELTVSNEVDLTDFFKQESFTVLLDLDFKDDDYKDQMILTLKMDLAIEHKI